MTLKLVIVASLLGAVMGASAATIALSLARATEDAKWRCIEYSPVNGACVLLEHKDRIRD